ncbi:PAP2 superfamily-domain-containing protein [Phellopilus nigrolimitatus]|nr:PAP2 superfamily-domain-containing protein [Phellopilus nigrolimitatus]
MRTLDDLAMSEKFPRADLDLRTEALHNDIIHDIHGQEEKRVLLDQPAENASSASSHTLVNTGPSSSPWSESSAPVPSDAVGTAPEEFYVRSLAPWRAAARQLVMRRLEAESALVARLQASVRAPWLDAYFVYTSSLGTHTFFMTALPALFFFGFPEVGRGLVFVLGMGVYVSSFIKDLICAPRPYAPPVSRLTIGTHHLEYGFPSTHSTNSVSIALYIYSLVHKQYFTSAAISTLTYSFLCVFLSLYAVSIVFGRLYTGMHSITDCVVGVALGTGVWGAHALWWSPIEAWVVGASGDSAWPSWVGPLAIALLCGLMVHWHPQPVDDCPCFEDAIAFVSVIAGMLLVRWAAVFVEFDDKRLASHMAGKALPFLSPPLSSHASAWRLAGAWWGMALLKLTLGIALIFAWRLLAKFVLHSLLPPIFRWLATRALPRLVLANVLPAGAGLPNRRFYTPATEYAGAVPEGGLHPIPSVMDLPATLHECGERDDEMGGMKRRKAYGKGRKKSDGVYWGEKGAGSEYLAPMGAANGSIYGGGGGTSDTSFNSKAVKRAGVADEDAVSEDEEVVKHYDADVLTKVVVYAGIGVLATGLVPIMFEVLGWGVHP